MRSRLIRSTPRFREGRLDWISAAVMTTNVFSFRRYVHAAEFERTWRFRDAGARATVVELLANLDRRYLGIVGHVLQAASVLSWSSSQLLVLKAKVLASRSPSSGICLE